MDSGLKVGDERGKVGGEREKVSHARGRKGMIHMVFVRLFHCDWWIIDLTIDNRQGTPQI